MPQAFHRSVWAILKLLCLLLLHLDSKLNPFSFLYANERTTANDNIKIHQPSHFELACSKDLASNAHKAQKRFNELFDLLFDRTLNLDRKSVV